MVNRRLSSEFLVAEPPFPVKSTSGPDVASADAAASLPVGVVAGVVIGSIGAVSLFVVLVCWIQARQKSRSPEDEKFLEQLSGLPPRFTYKDLEVATNNFSKVLGVGGFGTVYEGSLPSGTSVKVAVKKLHNIEKSSKGFRAEVAAVGDIHHKHLVQLRGFCAEGSERLLVYEFLPNGSLDKWLFSDERTSGSSRDEENQDDDNNNHDVILTQKQKAHLLSWSQRFSIAVGTVKGLAYLHDDCGRRILHLDIKPQNILLDEKFEAKVADFGLCQFMKGGPQFAGNSSLETSTTVKGTPGYTAPECILGVGITEKADVYSCGMVLFEIISGRKNIDSSLSESVSFYFPALANKVVKDFGYGHECLMHLADPRLEGIFDEDELLRVLKVALWCIQEVPRSRPQMREVVLMLEGKLSIPDPPLMKFSGLLQAQRIMKDHFEAQQTLSADQIEVIHSCDSPPPTSSDSSTGVASEISVHSIPSV